MSSHSHPTLSHRRLLAEALQLSRDLINGTADLDPDLKARRQARLQTIQAALQAVTHPIERDRLDVATIPYAVRLAFVRSVLLVARYHQVGGDRWQSTLGSPTLQRYRPDPLPEWVVQPGAIATLSAVFELAEPDRQSLQQQLDQVSQHIQRQHTLMTAILSDAELMPLAQRPPGAIATLFQQLFGAIPIPADALHLVYTPSQLYFCLDYGGDYGRDHGGDRLLRPEYWDPLGDEQRASVRAFLHQLGQFSFAKFRRFPIFGACDPAQINAEWCDRIAQQTNIPTAEVRQTLSRSVSIIPTAKAEAFLMHDIWGHYWQLPFTSFEGDYALLADCDEPLRATETAYTAHGPLTCGELFRVEGEQVYLDEALARQFFHGEVQQRLGLMFTHMLGELVADMAEFKFIWDHPHLDQQLPSSSLFKTFPTKLDLGLADLDFLFLRVLRPLLEVTLSVLTESELEVSVLHQWKAADYPAPTLEQRTSLKAAIARLYQLFFEEYNRTYLPTLDGDTGIFAQIVRNLLHLQNVVNALYTDLNAADHQRWPIQDLLMVFIASYCSSDCYAEFWQVDDAIAAYFLPCWHHLCDQYAVTEML